MRGQCSAVRARPARAQDGRSAVENFRLDEKVVEHAMHVVRDGRTEHDFGIARHFDRAAHERVVGDAHAAQFDIVFRRHGDFGVRLNVAVAAIEFDARFAEGGLITVRGGERWLQCVRPELAAGHVAHVTEHAPVVARAVLAPARDAQIVPAAVAAARIREHDVIAAVRQYLHAGHAGGRVGEYTYGQFVDGGNRSCVHQFRVLRDTPHSCAERAPAEAAMSPAPSVRRRSGAASACPAAVSAIATRLMP